MLNLDDIVCILLACARPKLLRPSGPNYLVVGDCFFHGIIEAEALLGPVPGDFRVEGWNPNGIEGVRFYHIPTGERRSEDPRLPPLLPEWKAVEGERTQDNPMFERVYRNTVTGETVNADPRMTMEALEGRGVELEKFRLV